MAAGGSSGAANSAAAAEHEPQQAPIVSTMEPRGRSPRSLSVYMHADAHVDADAAHEPHAAQPPLLHVPQVHAQAPTLRA